MSQSIEPMPRPVRRRLKKITQKSSDKDYARRAETLLHLAGARLQVGKTIHRVKGADL